MPPAASLQPSAAEVALEGMMKADGKLYERIMETPGFAFHFNSLCLLAAGRRRHTDTAQAAIDSVARSYGVEELTMRVLDNTSRNEALEPVLEYFRFAHLPAKLQGYSKPFAAMAHQIVETAKPGQQRTMALYLLLMAKDACVRAAL